jgi:GWxTD domain-containing protein
MEKSQQAEKFFWIAVDSSKTDADINLIFEDIKYMVNDKELDAYQKLSTVVAKKEFIHTLWATRDPMPAAPENVRLIEHYRRMQTVETYYRYDGFRTWMNNPDKLHYLKFPKAFQLNDKFNDKGLIYIRHGEPDDRAFTLAQSAEHNESWLYYAKGRLPKMMFHFVIAQHGGGNNWRLTPHLDQSWISDRIGWDAIFARYLQADALEMASLDYEMAEKCKKDVDIGLSTDRHTWPKELEPIEIPFYTAVFQGEGGLNWLEFYYGIPRSYLSGDHIDSTLVAEAGLVFHDRSWNRVFQQVDDLDLTALDEDDFQGDLYVGQWRALIAPDIYNVAMHFKIKSTLKLGGYRFQQKMIDYGAQELAMSSIELAHSIEPMLEEDQYTKHGLKIIPNPTLNFKRTDPVYLYYEIYNLDKNKENLTSFIVEHKISLLEANKQGLIRKALGIFSRGQEEVSSITEREGNDETSIEHLALDLSSTRSGKYRLTVTVHDRNTGDETTATREFYLN